MKIWPAIDIRAGKCVRLAQGDYERQTTYGSDPADMGMRWVNDGGKALHIVDLDGAKGDLAETGRSLNRDAIAEILSKCKVPCQIGGGIRDEAAIVDYLELGAARVVIGTKAITDTDWLARMANDFPERLAVGIDARGGKVATDGWLKTTEISAIEFAQQISKLPIGAIIYTDIARDGMLAGPNFEAMKEMAQATEIPVIASGGVTTLQDIEKLATMELSGCIIGRALYEGKMTLPDALNASEKVVS